MPKDLFPDIGPFRREPLNIDARLRRLFRDLREAFASFWKPNVNDKGGFQIASADDLTQLGHGIGGNDFGIQSRRLGETVVLGSTQGVYLKYNNYWDGTQDRFMRSGVPAWQLFFIDTLRFAWRRSLNTPTAGQPITWSGNRPVVPERGSNSNGQWVRFADGTQICWHTGFNTASQNTWIFPQAFVAPPAISATYTEISAPQLIFVINSTGAPTTTSWSFRKRYFDGSSINDAVAEVVSVTAIGRWYSDSEY